ncbi:hypothetical protein AB6A40_007168 [Gnathostoma spinigerum]|uniref:Uncharacterized protein n=1 Tax=Gnathostoma spinigerum TaxID=75299 RepID=A0ABD6EKG3_9BILA
MIEDAAHMADMYPPRDSDVSSLKEARISVQKILDNWITGETIAPKPKPTTTPKPEPTTTSKPEPTTAPKPESTTASKPGPTTKKPRPKPTEEDETEGAAVSDISFVLLTLSAAVVFPQMN